MKKVEYKHVRHNWGLRDMFSKRRYHESLMEMLDEQGREGWELKGVIYELGFHAHFVFGRDAQDGKP